MLKTTKKKESSICKIFKQWKSDFYILPHADELHIKGVQESIELVATRSLHQIVYLDYYINNYIVQNNNLNIDRKVQILFSGLRLNNELKIECKTECVKVLNNLTYNNPENQQSITNATTIHLNL